jgi:hypothetical protein
MNLEEKETEHLFAYGMLPSETVQRATFGRSIREQGCLARRAER